ncbi:type II secretion system protein, partial [bacterium]|nr:type II secretion system protein [bacterium]
MTKRKETHAQRHCERSVAIARLSNRRAFTLAEVLITLAIIGVVAAMTIPTLISNYQDKAFETASTTFQRKLGEALKVMNVNSNLAGFQTTESFVEELSKHIKITKTCSNDKLTDCFAKEVYWGTE